MIVTETGARIAPGIELAPNQWVDSFNRPDGPLGNGWTTGNDWDPTVYEPLGILNGAVVCTNPRQRGGVYTEPQDTPPNELDGELYQGIGCAYRDFGTDAIWAWYEWSGIWTPPSHTEGGPLLHVVPGSPEFGWGVWTTILGPNFALIPGALGNPPEDWGPVGVDILPHVEGTKRSVGLRSDGVGITTWLDGVQAAIDPYGLDPIPIPENLLGSTLHGFCVDTHLVGELDIPTTPVCHAVAFST